MCMRLHACACECVCVCVSECVCVRVSWSLPPCWTCKGMPEWTPLATPVVKNLSPHHPIVHSVCRLLYSLCLVWMKVCLFSFLERDMRHRGLSPCKPEVGPFFLLPSAQDMHASHLLLLPLRVSKFTILSQADHISVAKTVSCGPSC